MTTASQITRIASHAKDPEKAARKLEQRVRHWSDRVRIDYLVELEQLIRTNKNKTACTPS